jgi:hypothetical protein
MERAGRFDCAGQGPVRLVLPYLSNGTTFVAQNWVNTGQGYGSALSGTPGLLALDINGDGRTDLVQQWVTTVR